MIGRSITVPVLPLEKTEAQRRGETCQVSRKISDRVLNVNKVVFPLLRAEVRWVEICQMISRDSMVVKT